MRRVLVTGASGFIGRGCLQPLAERGFEVVALSSRDRPSEPGLSWRKVDLFDDAAVTAICQEARAHSLLHLAWCTEHGKYWTAPENSRWVEASLHLAREFRRAGGARFVGAGTCAEYAWNGQPCREGETPLQAATPYGQAKNSFRASLEALARESGLSYGWGRVFHVFGPQEDRRRLVPSVALSLLHGEPALCSAGTQKRDFAYVEDVSLAFVELLCSDFAGAVNIASGRVVTVAEVIRLVAEAAGRPELVRLGALKAATAEVETVCADISRLFQELGWRPRFSLEEGIQKTVEWWKQNEDHD